MSYLKVSNLSKVINKITILDNISFELEKGKLLVILGKSGAGKTTLLRNINLLDFPDLGTLELDGEILYNYKEKNISSSELQRRHKLIGLVFQNFNLFPHYNVLENVTLAVKIENKLKAKKDKMIDLNKLNEETNDLAIEILKELGLENKITNYPYQLSGGEQQRVAIARSLILKPKVLCFDEPTSALDPALTGEVVKVINNLKVQNQTMIVITHEMDFAYQIADKIIVIDKGKIIEEKDI